MVVVTLTYDATSGSDTGASGSGPVTPLTGINATVSGQVITLDGTPDLSGVAVDDCLYFESTDSISNRRLFKITAVDDGADTVTVSGTIVGTGVNWAIGGDRKTFQGSTRDDWLDWEAGWDIILNDGGTFTVDVFMDYVGGSPVTGPTRIKTVTGYSTKASIVVGAGDTHRLFHLDAVASSAETFLYEDLSLTTSASASSPTIWRSDFALAATFRRVDFDAQVDCIQLSSSQSPVFFECTFKSDTGRAIWLQNGSASNPLFLFCRFIDIPEEALDASGSGGERITLIGCVFDSCGGATFSTIDVDGGNLKMVRMINCVVYNSGDHGVNITGATLLGRSVHVCVNTIFVNCGGYGVNVVDTDGANALGLIHDTNAYYNNTSGQVNNLTQANAVTLTGDPFTDAAGGDFSLNNTAGAGAACKAAGLGLSS